MRRASRARTARSLTPRLATRHDVGEDVEGSQVPGNVCIDDVDQDHRAITGMIASQARTCAQEQEPEGTPFVTI